MTDLIQTNLETIIDLLKYTQWDYDCVGLVLLPPVTGNRLKIWLKENNMNKYPVEVVVMSSIPEHLASHTRGERKWEWLRKMLIKEMGPEAKSSGSVTRRLTFPNKKEMQGAQSAVGNSGYNRRDRHARTHFQEPGFKAVTRSDPVKDKNGAYYLYIQVNYERPYTVR